MASILTVIQRLETLQLVIIFISRYIQYDLILETVL